MCLHRSLAHSVFFKPQHRMHSTKTHNAIHVNGNKKHKKQTTFTYAYHFAYWMP